MHSILKLVRTILFFFEARALLRADPPSFGDFGVFTLSGDSSWSDSSWFVYPRLRRTSYNK